MNRPGGTDYADALAALAALTEAPAEAPTAGAEGTRPGEPADDEAELYFGSVDEFVREVIVPMYRRKVGPRGGRRWSAQWWRNAEAVSRLDSLWRAWEHLRLDGATGMSTWWRDHADYHMNALFDPDGPFAASTDENKAGEPLPYAPPPPGLFTDVRSA
ncbi:DUF4913 domain-containing protein [Streptomonospora nanhaiensis]|uniref:DUF4913 domain-containing protein n=1 Tax=Streptomonospora nanhaiensis TaxID=1323731 RepID=UPI0027E214F6|nr:DUF4913 domain-containing protein [Streptomonospora nanhaiensis]